MYYQDIFHKKWMKLFGTICIDVSFLYTCLNLEMCDLELGCLQPELGTLNIVDVDVRRRLTTSAKPSVTLIRYIWRVDDGSLSTVQHMLPFSPALAGKLLKPFNGGYGRRASLLFNHLQDRLWTHRCSCSWPADVRVGSAATSRHTPVSSQT